MSLMIFNKSFVFLIFCILLYTALALRLLGDLVGWDGLPTFLAKDHVVSAKIFLDIIVCPHLSVWSIK